MLPGSLTSPIADSAEKKPEEDFVAPEEGGQGDMKDGKKEQTSPESFAVHLEDSPASLPDKCKTSRDSQQVSMPMKQVQHESVYADANHARSWRVPKAAKHIVFPFPGGW